MSDASVDHAELADEARVRAVMESVAALGSRFAPHGFTPEIIFEGAVKGAVAQIIAAYSLTSSEAADLLEDFAAGLRAPTEKPTLRLVRDAN